MLKKIKPKENTTESYIPKENIQEKAPENLQERVTELESLLIRESTSEQILQLLIQISKLSESLNSLDKNFKEFCLMYAESHNIQVEEV